MSKFTVNINGNKIEVTRAKNDINGNPRYIVHFLSLGLTQYKATKKTRAAGLSIYKGKDYGGGFVFSSYSVESDLKWIISKLSANGEKP